MTIGNPTTGPQRPRVEAAPPSIIPNWQPGQSPISVAPRQILDRAPDTFERQIAVSALNEPCRVTLGRDRIAGQTLRPLLYGNSLLLAVHWGRGPIEQIESFTVGGVAAPSVIATHYLGTSSQTVDAKLVSAFAAISITHTDAFPGQAYSVFEFPVGTDIGDIHAVVKGVKPYDYRNGAHVLATPSTWTYSDNPALLLAHVLTNTTYGLGAAFDWAGSVAAFDACDNTAPGEKKRLIGMTMGRRMKAHEWCEILRAHAGCFIVRTDGKYKLVPDIAGSSVRTFGKNDIIKGTLKWSRTGLDQQPNVVQVNYTDTSVIPWKTASAVYPPNGIPPIGEELRMTPIDLSGVQRYSQAMREVHERRGHGRLEALQFSFDTFAEAIAQEPGDICTLNDGGLFGGVLFRLLEKRMQRKGRWSIVGKKYDPAVYNNSAEAEPTYGDTTLPTPGSPPTPTGLVLAEILEAPGVGGQPRSSISATWDPTVWPFLEGYRIYVYDDSGNLLQEDAPIATSWRSNPFAAPQRLTVYLKTRSEFATSSGYDSEQITLSGSATSLTLLTTTEVFAAGCSLLNYETYTLYPGDPYFRVAPHPSGGDVSFATQFATDAISAATPNVLSHNRFIGNQYRSDSYAKTAAIDLGATKRFTVAVVGGPTPNTFYLMIGFEAADSLAGPWTFANGGAVTLSGRYVRMVVAPRDDPPDIVFPDGGDALGPSPWANQFAEADFGSARISVYGATVEETGQATTSASGPVTVTLDGTYYAQRDLQVTALDSNGTAVVTFANVGPSPTAIHTFEINATVSGVRVAVPVRWNFKGAV